MKLILYHGTSEKNAKLIETEGFKLNKSSNWKIKSKRGFVYLSSAYAPFFAMASDKKGDGLALIKVEVDSEDCYPEDDFLMMALKKYPYNQKELSKVNFEQYKYLWIQSLNHLGNVAIKPDKIKILGISYFSGKHLLSKCDPTITPINYRIMGDYYKNMSEHIFEGKDILKFNSFMEVTQ